jgi:hypothetical protein
MKPKREASDRTKDEDRIWHIGRCKCGSVRAAVECGDGDEYSRRELVDHFGYVVSREMGPPKFQAHAESCGNKLKR